MIVLVGKTCSGKSTVADILDADYGIHRVRTYTTRPKREGEADNEYHFITDEEFEELRDKGRFFETTQYKTAIDEVWKYGTAKDEFCCDCCIVMNPDGVKKVKRLLPEEYDVRIIYLNVSEGVQWNRLKQRGAEDAPPDEAARRIEQDKIDFASISEFYDFAITTDNRSEKNVADIVFALGNEW